MNRLTDEEVDRLFDILVTSDELDDLLGIVHEDPDPTPPHGIARPDIGDSRLGVLLGVAAGFGVLVFLALVVFPALRAVLS